ncbi:GntR family transcriptional regulator [Leuconostoc fallax]|nr:GntR family transcriptional regulator [Leuconostoc fallax]MBU7456167.1 GntR family transcriptional regulator [Leuconostoc fallax]MCO6184156.1 GntR family transcriptional regulator [Leuconostoc fallax]
MAKIQHNQPLYEQLMWRIKAQVATSVLKVGDKLPSVREMALIEGLNPNTVAKAYKALEGQQVIETVAGKGTFVRQVDTVVDEKAINELRNDFNNMMIEAKRLQVTPEQLHQWIDEFYLEGQQ